MANKRLGNPSRTRDKIATQISGDLYQIPTRTHLEVTATGTKVVIDKYVEKEIKPYIDIRDLNKKDFKAFQALVKNVSRETSFNIPSTLKEYTKQYQGNKTNARSDYIFEWNRIIQSYLSGKAAVIRQQTAGNDFFQSTGVNFQGVDFRQEQIQAIRSPTDYYQSKISPSAIVKKLTKINQKIDDYQSGRMMRVKASANEIATIRQLDRPVSLGDFRGSRALLATANMYRAARNAGYHELLTVMDIMEVRQIAALWNDSSVNTDLKLVMYESDQYQQRYGMENPDEQKLISILAMVMTPEQIAQVNAKGIFINLKR